MFLRIDSDESDGVFSGSGSQAGGIHPCIVAVDAAPLGRINLGA